MRTTRNAFVIVAALVIVAIGPAMPATDKDTPPARTTPAGEVTMENVGKSYLFDYGDLVIGVRYASDRRLTWEQIQGPQAGLKGEETYEATLIRPGVYFIWWQEKDTSVVAQVVDFEKGRVHTTWISPEKKVAAFQGAVRPRDR
jgi:hypothetical protein